MTRLLRALLALLLAGLPAAGHARPAPHAAVHPALWRVTGRNTTIYLFGTVHLLPAGVHWFDGRVARAFGKSDELITEIIEPSAEAMRPIVLAKAMLPEGAPGLRDMLAPADAKRLEAALLANGFPPASFDRFQPWYAAVALATAPLLHMGYDPASGVDSQLAKLAGARAREALETPEFQLGLFAALPPEVQKKYLLEVVKHLPELRSELTGIIRAWKVGNAPELARLMNEDEDDPEIGQVLLIDRNRNWAKWIAERLAKPGDHHETLFIAVGAGHLAGSGSVQDQLRALGIASQRIQ